MEEDSPVVFTKAEKQNLSTFCNLCLKSKSITEKTKDTLKDAKDNLKNLRERMMNLMKNIDVVLIPVDVRRRINVDLDEEMPPYIRVVKNNKDNVVTIDTIKDCIMNISPEDVIESSKENGVDTLLNLILNGLRRNIRSYTQQVRLVHSVPRGIKAADIEIANQEQIECAVEMHKLLLTILNTEEGKREILKELKQQIKEKQPDIESFFDKTNVNSQRVILENCAYNLIRRVSICKPKLNIRTVNNIFIETLNELLIQKSKTVPSKKLIFDNLQELKETLSQTIETKILTLPSTTKTDIFLKRVVQRAEE